MEGSHAGAGEWEAGRERGGGAGRGLSCHRTFRPPRPQQQCSSSSPCKAPAWGVGGVVLWERLERRSRDSAVPPPNPSANSPSTILQIRSAILTAAQCATYDEVSHKEVLLRAERGARVDGHFARQWDAACEQQAKGRTWHLISTDAGAYCQSSCVAWPGRNSLYPPPTAAPSPSPPPLPGANARPSSLILLLLLLLSLRGPSPPCVPRPLRTAVPCVPPFAPHAGQACGGQGDGVERRRRAAPDQQHDRRPCHHHHHKPDRRHQDAHVRG